MKHIKHLFAVCLLLLAATTATAQSQSDNTQTKAVSATKADVNGDGVVNEADIEEIIAIMQQENGTKYYWYAGWTEPTEANIGEIINEEYPTASGSITNNKAGKTATSTSGVTMDYTKNTLYNSAAKTNYYVVVPNGQSVYDSNGTDLIKDPYLFGGTPYSTFANHNVYKTTTTSRNINAIIIK